MFIPVAVLGFMLKYCANDCASPCCGHLLLVPGPVSPWRRLLAVEVTMLGPRPASITLAEVSWGAAA